MSATVHFDGLVDLYEALRNLPADLTAEATTVVQTTADQAAADVIAAYPVVTGNLKGHVKTKVVDGGEFGAAVVVRSTAKHARMYESGSQTRQTAIGANRGAMPGANIMIPILARYRADMIEQLIAIVERSGLTVRRS